jgi:hypothetical protein
MKLKELFDLFEATYKIECLKANVKEIALNKKLEGLWVSMAIQDLLREVKEFENHFDIDVIPNVLHYTLPDDFGFAIDVTTDNGTLDITSKDQIPINPNSLATKFAIYSDGISNQIIFDGSVSSARVRYYTSSFLYSPAGTQVQSFGTFDGYSASGDIIIADYYIPAVIEFMLSKMFNDRIQMYQFEVQKLKFNRINSAPDQTSYSMG